MRDRESTGENIGDASSREAELDHLRAMRPVQDELKLALAREAAERRLFGAAAPARIGRFALLGEHAAGGMGVVYAAYDPQLDRRVALKLLNPVTLRSPAIRERLLTEARALARLDHPNVVPIHDVVVIEGQFVLVIEWVEGKTLANWEAEAPRSWRECVDAFHRRATGSSAAPYDRGARRGQPSDRQDHRAQRTPEPNDRAVLRRGAKPPRGVLQLRDRGPDLEFDGGRHALEAHPGRAPHGLEAAAH